MTKILVSAAAAIAFWSWSSASANVLTVTDIGTVVGGYDGLGLFGTAGADLIGNSYEAVFTFDLSGPRRASGCTSAARASAWVMSWTWPPVRRSANGLPKASTITWILVVGPPHERPMAWSKPHF